MAIAGIPPAIRQPGRTPLVPTGALAAAMATTVAAAGLSMRPSHRFPSHRFQPNRRPRPLAAARESGGVKTPTFRFTIRDVLWLTVVVALALSWWIDNQRIETSVAKLESDRRELQADFDDKLSIVNDMQIKASKELERITLSAQPGSTNPRQPVMPN